MRRLFYTSVTLGLNPLKKKMSFDILTTDIGAGGFVH